jgi:type I restriction enzyme S subunit
VSIGIRSFGKGLFHYDPAAGDQLGKLRFFELPPDRLVLSNIKAWEGAVAVSTARDAECIASNRFLIYAPVDDRIDVRWARWYFVSEAGNESLQGASPGSADRNRTLAIDRFEALKIPLPPIDEQRRVAALLDGIEVGAMELRRLSELESTILNAFSWSLTARLDLSSAAKVRAGWQKLQLSDVLMERAHQVPVRGDLTYNIAGVYSFGRGLFARAPLEGSATSYKVLHQLRQGQLVMSRLKAWEGAIAVVPPALDGWFLSPEFPTFDIDSKPVNPEFFESLVTSEGFWKDLGGESRGIGARRERVHAARLLEQRIEVPPLETQRSVAHVLTTLRDVSDHRSEAANRVEALVPAALNEAFASFN